MYVRVVYPGVIMAISTIGLLRVFNPDKDKLDAYLEHVQLFMDANDIRGDEK